MLPNDDFVGKDPARLRAGSAAAVASYRHLTVPGHAVRHGQAQPPPGPRRRGHGRPRRPAGGVRRGRRRGAGRAHRRAHAQPLQRRGGTLRRVGLLLAHGRGDRGAVLLRRRRDPQRHPRGPRGHAAAARAPGPRRRLLRAAPQRRRGHLALRRARQLLGLRGGHRRAAGAPTRRPTCAAPRRPTRRGSSSSTRSTRASIPAAPCTSTPRSTSTAGPSSPRSSTSTTPSPTGSTRASRTAARGRRDTSNDTDGHLRRVPPADPLRGGRRGPGPHDVRRPAGVGASRKHLPAVQCGPRVDLPRSARTRI